MHHTPAVVLGADRQNNTGLRRIWWHACLEENINPRKHTRLPLLFALDAKLNVGDGFRYEPDCESLRQGGSGGTTQCGGDFSDSSYDGSTDGFGDSSSGDGGGGGDSGGDGGGCGGGGD